MVRMIYPGEGEPSDVFTYDPGGRLTTKRDRKGIVTTFEYDALGRLLRKSYSDGTPAATYTYDERGNIGRLTSASNGTDTLSWTYDLAGQLLRETSERNASVVAYSYDLGGARVSLKLDGAVQATYLYDDASPLTSISRGPSVFSFGYDDAGRRTSLAYPNGVTTSSTYDSLGQLSRLRADLGTTPVTDFQYDYDVVGNRTRKQQLDYAEDYARPALSRHSRQPALFLSCRPVFVDTPEPPASRCPSRCALPTPRTCSGGASVRHVQKLLGHSSIQWRTIYTRVFSKDLAKMVDEAHRREWAYNRLEKRT